MIIKHRKMVRALIFACILFCTCTALISCYSPSPLYGSWADNSGNSINFVMDGSFTAKIAGTSGTETYTGTYNVLDNIIVFSYEKDGYSYSTNTEWDIRGYILYCWWVDRFGDPRQLTLYHTSR